jgi:hypothetical protein
MGIPDADVIPLLETRHESFRYRSRALKAVTQAFSPSLPSKPRRKGGLLQLQGGDDGLEPWTLLLVKQAL